MESVYSRNHNATPLPSRDPRETRLDARDVHGDVARGGASWGAHAAKTQKRRGIMLKEKLYECQLMSVASFTDYTVSILRLILAYCLK